MARIVIGSYLVQFPMGGYLSWVLQFLVGLTDLGHDVYFMERSISPASCFDPVAGMMTDDATHGASVVHGLLSRYGLGAQWSFVDFEGRYLGLSEARVNEVMRTADLFIDMGARGAWAEDMAPQGIRVLLDGEPGANQMKMAKAIAAGEELPCYDFFYTVGGNIAKASAAAPQAGREWHHLFYPVSHRLFPVEPTPEGAPFTTVMSWQAHDHIEFEGVTYGAKDIEFPKFIDLPARVTCPMEVAIAGRNAPRALLAKSGWRVRDSHALTSTFDAFLDYIRASRGEFTVCKNVFVATRSGWFGDRAAAYLASARPVVMQDTGFGDHLPCGRGLFAVETVEEAAEAIHAICGDYRTHAEAALDIARSCLDTDVVLPGFLNTVGL